VLLTAMRTPARMKSRNRARDRIFMRRPACHSQAGWREEGDGP
jgi:hypothetical protein